MNKRKLAVVTGGSRGIGKAICLRLASDGFDVIVNYVRNSLAAEEVVSEIIAKGAKAKACCFNVSEEGAVNEAFKEIISEFGRLDVLINNAGIAKDGLLARMNKKDWDEVLSINLSSCFLCSKAACRPMMKRRWGRIVNIASIIGQGGNAGQIAYAASKSGIFGFTKSLAQELGSRNITVNSIAPGYIETDMTGEISEDARLEVLKRIPLNKLGSPEDVSGAVSFLVSPDASWITGQVIAINGGMRM